MGNQNASFLVTGIQTVDAVRGHLQQFVQRRKCHRCTAKPAPTLLFVVLSKQELLKSGGRRNVTFRIETGTDCSRALRPVPDQVSHTEYLLLQQARRIQVPANCCAPLGHGLKRERHFRNAHVQEGASLGVSDLDNTATVFDQAKSTVRNRCNFRRPRQFWDIPSRQYGKRELPAISVFGLSRTPDLRWNRVARFYDLPRIDTGIRPTFTDVCEGSAESRLFRPTFRSNIPSLHETLRRPNIVDVYDVVASLHRIGSVTGDPHANNLRNASPPHVSHRRAAQIVKLKIGNLS